MIHAKQHCTHERHSVIYALNYFAIAKATAKPPIFGTRYCTAFSCVEMTCVTHFHDPQMVADQRDWFKWKMSRPKINGRKWRISIFHETHKKHIQINLNSYRPTSARRLCQERTSGHNVHTQIWRIMDKMDKSRIGKAEISCTKQMLRAMYINWSVARAKYKNPSDEKNSTLVILNGKWEKLCLIIRHTHQASFSLFCHWSRTHRFFAVRCARVHNIPFIYHSNGWRWRWVLSTMARRWSTRF